MSKNEQINMYASVISEQVRKETGKTLDESLEAAKKAATKDDRDAYHVGSVGDQHAFAHDPGDRGESASYSVHDMRSGKVHHVSVPLNDRMSASHGTIKKALGQHVHPDMAKHIHKDIKDNYAE